MVRGQGVSVAALFGKRTPWVRTKKNFPGTVVARWLWEFS